MCKQMFRKNPVCCRKKRQQAIRSKQLGSGALCCGYGHCCQWGQMERNTLPGIWSSELSASLILRSWPVSNWLPPHHSPYSSDFSFSLWILLYFQQMLWLCYKCHSKKDLLVCLFVAGMNYVTVFIIHIPLKSNPLNQMENHRPLLAALHSRASA